MMVLSQGSDGSSQRGPMLGVQTVTRKSWLEVKLHVMMVLRYCWVWRGSSSRPSSRYILATFPRKDNLLGHAGSNVKASVSWTMLSTTRRS